MDHQRQTDSIRRRACQVQALRFVAALFCEVRRAANLDPTNHVAVFGDDALDVLNAAIPQVVQLTQRGKRADAADHSLSRNVQQREDSGL